MSQKAVTLPLNEPKDITIKATPKAGAHSALLRLDDPSTKGLDFAVMNVVVAGTELPAPSYGWSKTAVAQRNEATRYYLTVPAGTKALQMKMSGVRPGQPHPLPRVPPVRRGHRGSVRAWSATPTSRVATGVTPTNRVYANPQPGVWEFVVESRRTSRAAGEPVQARRHPARGERRPGHDQPRHRGGRCQQPAVVERDQRVRRCHRVGEGWRRWALPSRRGRRSRTTRSRPTRSLSRPGRPGSTSRSATPSDAAADLDLFVTGPSGAEAGGRR